MILKNITHEDFIQYRKPSLFLGFPSCSWKCEKEYKDGTCKFCQNAALFNNKSISIDVHKVINSYLTNDITSAIVMGGLEPLDSFGDVKEFVDLLRNNYSCADDIVIYTGYNEEEVRAEILFLKNYSNIIIKFGRYLPESEPIYDEVLGATLASSNQYAKRTS